MPAGADFSVVGKALSSPARSIMVGMLLDGGALTATELARLAEVSPSTASDHLSSLLDSGLVAMSASGRHRYFTLASPEVAEALEALARICPVRPVRSLRHSEETHRLSLARTCYDHLAGAVAVSILDSLLGRGHLVAEEACYRVTPTGEALLGDVGVQAVAPSRSRRPFARPCLDWTERRPHLAGALGAGMASALLDSGWFRRVDGSRGLAVTARGVTQLKGVFGIEVGGS